jgi:16S rRNA pseudouridine516 synthase
MASLRIDKLIAAAAKMSRSAARETIRQGRVSIDGVRVCECDMKADTEAHITLDGRAVTYREFAYIMLNKPAGFLSATEDVRDKTVLDLLPEEYLRLGLFCAGRLDKDSEGLLLLTNDGDFCHSIISPKKNIKKEYYVEFVRPLSPGAEDLFASGIRLGDGTRCLPARLELLDKGLSAKVVISEGKFHQVKRMVWAAGGEVKYLRRLAIGGLRLDEGLPAGHWRELSRAEKDSVLNAGL